MSQAKVRPTKLRDIFLPSPYLPCQKLCCLIVFMSAVKKAIFMAFFSVFSFYFSLYNYGSIGQIGVKFNETELLKYVLILFIVRILHWYFGQFDILCNLYNKMCEVGY